MKALFFVLIVSLSLIAGEKIRMQLNWKPQFEFAAFYMAKEFGFYDEAGLDVELLHLDPEHPVDIIRKVDQNEVDVALSYSSIIPLAAKSGKYMLLSYLFQNSPLVALSKRAPKQLDESCLYLSKNEYDGSIDLMLRKMGVMCRKPYDMQAFLNDPKGIITSTLFKDTKDFFVLDPLQYGFSMYDDILFSSKEYYKVHKVALRKFVLATLKGWRYALGNIDAAATIIHQKYAPAFSVEELKKQAKEILAYSILSPSKTGLFNPQRVEKIFDMYKEYDLLNEKVDIYTFIDSLFIDTLPLGFKQRELIARTPVLYSETDWPPFSMIDQKHNVSGMIEDYMEIIRRRTGLDMRFVYKESWSDVLLNIKQGRLDMAMATGETQERREYAVFSKPYDTYDFAIASKREHLYGDIDSLKGKKIAVGKSYTAEAVLRNKYRGVNVVSVKTTAEALALLEKGEVDAVVDIFPVVSYEIVEGQYRDMVISGYLPEQFDLKAMFRKDLAPIRDIFNLALDSISKEERDRIKKRYDSKIVYVINVQKERYFMMVITLLLVLLAIAVFFGIRYKREIQRRKEAEKLLLKQVTHDPLTQLYNRRFFNTFMETELAFAKRYGATILFGIFDIDNFKLFNDHYGHLEGDEVLRMIAKRVKEICKRRSDFVFRLGGEEFGIYTRLENEENIGEYIEQIVKEIEALHIEHPLNAPYGVVTISLGVVVARIHPNADVTLEAIYKKADDLMYKAKKQGKNRAVFEVVEYGKEERELD